MRIPVYADIIFDKELSLLKENVVYDFEVCEAEDKISNAGNSMTVVYLQPLVTGIKFQIKEFFTLINIEKNRRAHFFQLKRMKSFLESIGVPYQEDSLNHILHKKGKFILTQGLNEKTNTKYWNIKEYVAFTKKNAIVTIHEGDAPYQLARYEERTKESLEQLNPPDDFPF